MRRWACRPARPGRSHATANCGTLRRCRLSRLYTGVLYDNLGLADLDPDRVARSVLIFSGLWGALRVTDRVPRTDWPWEHGCPVWALWRPSGALC